MDIIIRNGVIQSEESKRINKIKNNTGLLKKDYKDYIKGIPGPYYDFLDCHLCIPRKYNQIQNFSGPQHKKKTKLIYTKDFNKLIKYCCICHCEIRPIPCFPAKRKIFIEEDTFARKVETNFDIQEQFKKIKINHEDDNNEIDAITTRLKKTSVDINSKWKKFYNKINKLNRTDNINITFRNYKSIQQRIINKYYQIVYKLVKTPILYPISNTETKLIWPWDLTKYQKFKLNNPNYKTCVMFSHRINYKIAEKYVIIE